MDTAATDDFGKVFDPARHMANADGSPRFRITPRGKRALMPRGVPRAARTAAPAAAPVPDAAPVALPQPAPEAAPQPAAAAPDAAPQNAAPAAPAVPPSFADFDRLAAGKPEPGTDAAPLEVVSTITHEASAEAWLRGSYAVCDAALNGRGEWQPEDQSEHVGLKNTLVAWQKARAMAPLPPGGAFIAAALAYIWKRLRQPNTAKTIVRILPGLAPFLGIEEPKKPAPAAAAAQPAQPAAPQPAAKPAPQTSPELSTQSRTADASQFFGG